LQALSLLSVLVLHGGHPDNESESAGTADIAVIAIRVGAGISLRV